MRQHTIKLDKLSDGKPNQTAKGPPYGFQHPLCGGGQPFQGRGCGFPTQYKHVKAPTDQAVAPPETAGGLKLRHTAEAETHKGKTAEKQGKEHQIQHGGGIHPEIIHAFNGSENGADDY